MRATLRCERRSLPRGPAPQEDPAAVERHGLKAAKPPPADHPRNPVMLRDFALAHLVHRSTPLRAGRLLNHLTSSTSRSRPLTSGLLHPGRPDCSIRREGELALAALHRQNRIQTAES
jgi:hypothetical protein